jgi:metal-sulfur cluster biosynthetic enzyme
MMMSVDPRMVEQAVIRQLQKVIDPETRVDVVRMRLIAPLCGTGGFDGG